MRRVGQAADEGTAAPSAEILSEQDFRDLKESMQPFAPEGEAGLDALSFEALSAADLRDLHDYLKHEVDPAPTADDLVGSQPAPSSPQARSQRRRVQEPRPQPKESSPSRVAPLGGPKESEKAARGEGESWDSLIEKFFMARPGIGMKTAESHRVVFQQFRHVVGDAHVRSVTEGDVTRYVEWLESQSSGRNGHRQLKHATLVKKISHLQSFFVWAVERSYVAANVAAKIKPRGKTKEEIRNPARRAFTLDELRQLLASPLFTGCASPRTRHVPGTMVLRNEHYWFFLVCLLAGARVEELAEAPSALVDLEGVLCIDLRASGTKTKAAPRLVPVIPALKETGFVEWAAHKEKRSAKLFKGGESSKDWSKATNRYLDDIGLIDPLLVTHSFRHSFRQMLRAANINRELANKVFGHSVDDTDDDVGLRYGAQLSPQEARAVVEHVEAPISLAHLGRWPVVPQPSVAGYAV